MDQKALVSPPMADCDEHEVAAFALVYEPIPRLFFLCSRNPSMYALFVNFRAAISGSSCKTIMSTKISTLSGGLNFFFYRP